MCLSQADRLDEYKFWYKRPWPRGATHRTKKFPLFPSYILIFYHRSSILNLILLDLPSLIYLSFFLPPFLPFHHSLPSSLPLLTRWFSLLHYQLRIRVRAKSINIVTYVGRWNLLKTVIIPSVSCFRRCFVHSKKDH